MWLDVCPRPSSRTKPGNGVRMIYVKSVLAGLIALILVPIFLIGVLIVGMLIYTFVHSTQGEGSVGWDPISLWHMNPIFWSIPALIFLTGFIWEYRRLTR